MQAAGPSGQAPRRVPGWLEPKVSLIFNPAKQKYYLLAKGAGRWVGDSGLACECVCVCVTVSRRCTPPLAASLTPLAVLPASAGLSWSCCASTSSQARSPSPSRRAGTSLRARWVGGWVGVAPRGPAARDRRWCAHMRMRRLRDCGMLPIAITRTHALPHMPLDAAGGRNTVSGARGAHPGVCVCAGWAAGPAPESSSRPPPHTTLHAHACRVATRRIGRLPNP